MGSRGLLSAGMTITVHHLKRSRSHRVLWMLEELETPYTIESYDRDPRTQRAPDALRRVHPLGRAPVVEIDGVVLAESGAILDTLAERFAPSLAPRGDSDEARRYRFFLHYAEGSLMPPLLVSLLTSRIRSAPVPFFIKPIARGIAAKVDGAYTDPEVANHLSFVNSELAEREFVAGDRLTAADVQMSYPLKAAESRAGFSEYPSIERYLERLRSRPAYERALDKGGPVTL